MTIYDVEEKHGWIVIVRRAISKKEKKQTDIRRWIVLVRRTKKDKTHGEKTHGDKLATEDKKQTGIRGWIAFKRCKTMYAFDIRHHAWGERILGWACARSSRGVALCIVQKDTCVLRSIRFIALSFLVVLVMSHAASKQARASRQASKRSSKQNT